jgi:hypothetical protein
MDKLIYKVMDKFDSQLQAIEEARVSPYQKAIRLVFAKHKEESSTWKMKASRVLQQEMNAVLYIEAGDDDREEILKALMAEIDS